MTLTSRMIWLALGLALSIQALATPAVAQKAPFDLAGPTLRADVTRGGVTLPIGDVPVLAPGDAIAIRADLPSAQAARYVLVVAFLRGATNPPPKDWFFALKTWEHGGHGVLRIKVPPGARQALLFLAPHTEGDFDTLRGAVLGRPGAFVRASQDLGQLGLERGRLKTYLDAVRRTERDDPAKLQDVSTALARTLGIKLDTSCFQKTLELQAPCLLKDQDSLVLNDQGNASLVQSLSSGASADLMTQLGAAPQIGGGAYSPYVGAVLDMARLLDSLRTAHYQYVPALEETQGDDLSLRLNTAPSFGGTKSVLVAALPPVESAPSPVLHASVVDGVYCLQAPDTVLEVDGAPLAFSTGFARNMVLDLKSRAGEAFEVPARADPEKGGFVVDTASLAPRDFGPVISGTLRGDWGFAPFQGPSFRFEVTAPGLWNLDEKDRPDLVAGHNEAVRLTGGPATCVTSVVLDAAPETPVKLGFKATGAREITLAAPLSHATPGPAAFQVTSFGLAKPDTIAIDVLAEETHLRTFEIHAGDSVGLLGGEGLSAVARLRLGGANFLPSAASDGASADDSRSLIAAEPAKLSGLTAKRRLVAIVVLKSGRELRLPVTILPARPVIALLAQSVSAPLPAPAIPISVEGNPVVPRGDVLSFSIRAEAPAVLEPRETLEVGTADGAWSTTLSSGAGLTREDAHVAVARLDTAGAFGPSAFGPLRFRLVDSRGESDWIDLATLVRLPSLEAVKCLSAAAAQCLLTGSNLFLLQDVASGPAFEDQVAVPEGFPGDQIAIPHPRNGKLYLKLHDDPAALAVATLPVRAVKARTKHKGKTAHGAARAAT